METVAIVEWKPNGLTTHRWEYFYDPNGINLSKVIKRLTKYQQCNCVSIEYIDLDKIPYNEALTLSAICKRI